MQILISFEPAYQSEALTALAAAVAFRDKPEGWLDAEYAMTKASAVRALRDLQRQGPALWTLDLFDWQVLQGELARLYKAELNSAAFSLFREIRAAIQADAAASALFSRIGAVDAAVDRLNAAEEALAAARAHVMSCAAEAAASRRDAAAFYQDRPAIEAGHATPPE